MKIDIIKINHKYSQLLTTDILVLATMKNAAKCET